MESIHQPNLSEQLAQRIRERILDARMHGGVRINEVHLAAELGVSRTPLREALTRLVSEGALDSIARRGFFVRPLTVAEFEDIYSIRPLLDPEALRRGGIPDRAQLAKLTKLNAALRKARDVEEALHLDDCWHLELVAGCPSKTLLELIEQFMGRTRRYEMALMGNRVNVRTACATHASILTSLRRGDLNEACRLLLRNLMEGKAPILAWLKQHESKQEKNQ